MHTNYKCGQKGNTQLPVLIKGRQALPSNEGETIHTYHTLIK